MDLITDAILKNVLEEHERDFNQSIIYGKEAEAGSVIAEAKGYPMMAERRVVVLKEAQDFRAIDDLEAYFSNPSEQTVFVVNFKYKNYDSRKKAAKAAAKNGVFLKCEKIKDYKLADWIGSYVCLLYTSPSPRDRTRYRMPSSA